MKNSSALKRIKEFIDFKGLSNKHFEVKVGFSNGAFASQLKRNRTIGVDKLEKILSVYEDLSPQWVLTGQGNMLKEESNFNFENRVESIPLIPYDLLSGYDTGIDNLMKEHTIKYKIPEFEQLKVDFMIKVMSDCMAPKYCSGDLLACRKLPIDSFFQWNKAYIIDTVQGPLVRKVNKSKIDDSILLGCVNDQYPPFDMKIKEILSLAIICGVVRHE
jgi:hypothetical protein